MHVGASRDKTIHQDGPANRKGNSPLSAEISGVIAKDTVTELARYHRVQASPGFSQAAEYIASKAKEYGPNRCRSKRFPADGQKTYYTLKSTPGLGSRTGELWETEPRRRR